MKFFKFLSWWEKIFYGFVFLMLLDLVLGMFTSGFKGGLGVGGLLEIYAALQTAMTLLYRSINRYPQKERDDTWKKQMDQLTGWRTLLAGFNIYVSVVLWIATLTYNFILAPIILRQIARV